MFGKSIKKEKLEDDFLRLLGDIKPTPEFVAVFKEEALSIAEMPAQAITQGEPANNDNAGKVAPLVGGLTPQEIMARGCFWVTPSGVRYKATLAEGIDFSREGWPAFVKEIKGVSGVEPWGRWSDAKINKFVEVEFVKPLPTSFVLILRAQPFGRNVGVPVQIKIGDYSGTVVFSGGVEEKRIEVVTKTPASKIQISPPLPESPASKKISSDDRELGLGFERLWIEAN